MALVLYRLGRFSYRQRRLVGLIWLLILAGAGVGAVTLSGSTTDSFAIPGTESQVSIDLLEEKFPGLAADGATARVVFQAPEGATLADPAIKQTISEVVELISRGPQVAQVADPYDAELISHDRTIGIAQVTYTGNSLELTDQTREVLDDAAHAGRDAGLTVELGGDAIEEVSEISGELVGLLVAALVLIITLGSLVAAGLPLITGIAGVAVGVCVITAATGFIDIGSTTPILAVMLGLAVAIDYALFIVSRYRHELNPGAEDLGRDGAEAAGRAIGTAGSAVVFAGLTVMIALVGLSVVGIPLLTEMGLAAAFTVGIAVLIALTMLPALLGFAGRRVLGGRILRFRARDLEADDATSASGRWVRGVTARPVATLVMAVGALAVAMLPVADLRLGLPDQGTYPADTTQRKSYDLIAEGFGPGFNGPLTVVFDDRGSGLLRTAIGEATSALSVNESVVAVSEPMVSEAGDTVVIQVVPATGPDSKATNDLVETIRQDVAGIVHDHGVTLGVTGLTAILIDFNSTVGDALLLYLFVVVGLSVVLLMIVFRSIIVPLKAALGFVLSVAATFGALVAVFQWGWLEAIGIEPTGQVVSILPVFIIGVVFGLAMDYEVFLVTRMREEYVRGVAAVPAVIVGYQHSARVVAAAATIMFGVFAGFVLADAADIIQMGFALAVAILFDAFIVRMTIVPAVLSLVGDRAWWLPSWLDNVLPNVDVEGERLAQYLKQREQPSSATIGA
jgi:RND superfamily putative drug exporter